MTGRERGLDVWAVRLHGNISNEDEFALQRYEKYLSRQTCVLKSAHINIFHALNYKYGNRKFIVFKEGYIPCRSQFTRQIQTTCDIAG